MRGVVHETIGRQAFAALRCIDQDLAVFDCPYHRHPEFEIVRIEQSQGRILVGDRESRFGPGDLFVFGGTLPHAFLNEEGTRRARSRYVQFDPELIRSTVALWPEAESLDAVLRQSRRGLAFRGREAARISGCLEALFRAEGVERIAELLRLLAEISSTCDKATLLASEGYELREPDRNITRLEVVLGYLHEHFREPLPMETLASQAGMSLPAFHRFFRERMGQAPGSYLLEVRLSHIARQLIETEASVSEIAFAAGFNNLSNFNRQFLRRFGDTPGAYRRRTVGT